jgi:hypothetical protein
MKTCHNCQIEKDESAFRKGKYSWCIDCARAHDRARKDKRKAQRRQYRQANILKIKLYEATRREQHSEKIAKGKKASRIKHREKTRAYEKAYFQKNKGRKYSWTAKRRAAKLQRTPAWADLKAIEQIYINCPDGMVVDHIIPLQGKNISGLHVPENLHYVTPKHNMEKGSRFPYYPLSFYKSKGLL